MQNRVLLVEDDDHIPENVNRRGLVARGLGYSYRVPE